jgi:hypothetical protein
VAGGIVGGMQQGLPNCLNNHPTANRQPHLPHVHVHAPLGALQQLDAHVESGRAGALQDALLHLW